MNAAAPLLPAAHSPPPPWLSFAVAASLAGCASEAKRIPIDVPPARAPSTEARIAEEVARLLSPEASASERALRVLSNLDDDGKAALAAHAAKIRNETDPRWLTVLDTNGLLADAGPAVRADLLAWQASRRDPGLVWRAQSGLLDLARTNPDVLIAKLSDRRCPARDAIAVALADAGVKRAIPALVELYRAPGTPAERRASTIALGRLAGEERKPRLDATDTERERDVDRLLAWYRTTGGTDAAR